MPYRIGVYHISFSTVYKIMRALEILNLENYDDKLLEFGINVWLCDQNKMNVLAAYIRWDDQPGIILVSSFEVRDVLMHIATADGRILQYFDYDLGSLEEAEKDRVIVKRWLI